MRRLIVLAAVGALLVGSPAAADMPNSGIHLEHGAKNAEGCYGLALWNNDTLVKTFAAPKKLGFNDVCPFSDWSVALPNGRFIFEWNYWREATDPNGTPDIARHTWTTDGTVDGTTRLHIPCQVDAPPDGDGVSESQVVGGTLFIWGYSCRRPNLDAAIFATKGTQGSTYRLLGNDPSQFVSDGTSIVFAAYGAYPNWELWSSRNGGRLVKDIWPGPQSSNIRDLVSHGSYATFTANDGHGRAHWITDGTVKGTHKVNS